MLVAAPNSYRTFKASIPANAIIERSPPKPTARTKRDRAGICPILTETVLRRTDLPAVLLKNNQPPGIGFKVGASYC